jgi:hypothetical protein
MLTLGLSPALANEFHVSLGRADAPLGLLLERVQDVDRLRKADRIHSTPSIATVVGNDFKQRASAKAFQRLGCRVGFSLLSSIEGLTDIASDLFREASQISAA